MGLEAAGVGLALVVDKCQVVRVHLDELEANRAVDDLVDLVDVAIHEGLTVGPRGPYARDPVAVDDSLDDLIVALGCRRDGRRGAPPACTMPACTAPEQAGPDITLTISGEI